MDFNFFCVVKHKVYFKLPLLPIVCNLLIRRAIILREVGRGFLSPWDIDSAFLMITLRLEEYFGQSVGRALAAVILHSVQGIHVTKAA